MVSSTFSRYRVLSRLGQGGMGDVFLAEDTSLGRKVALKFLQPDEHGSSEAALLLREARAAAHLDHPFICKVYEVGEAEGRAYLAMEFVDGVTLADRLARGPIPLAEALRIASEMADALHFAHSRGLVHRDLKPANVMLGAQGHVKVMDFGIARWLPTSIEADASTLHAGTVSVPGHLTGTLAYMAPEQLRAAPADARVDVFAFGLLLFQMITGRHAFERRTGLETATAILGEPAPPLVVDGHEAPPLLAHLVTRCLEKAPERRYQSLSDVAVELDTIRTPSSTATAPVAPPRRSRMGWAVATLMAAAAVLVLARPLLLTPEPALAFSERDWLVVADFNNLTKDPVFDRSLRLALEVAIAQSQYVNVFPQSRVTATLHRMQRRDADTLDESAAVEVAAREGVRAVLACDIAELGGVYSLTARLIDPQTKVPVLTDSVDAASKAEVLGALGRLAGRVRSNLGESLNSLSERSAELPQVTTTSLDALKLYADSLRTPAGQGRTSHDMLRQALALDPDFALAHADLGRRYYLAANRASRELGETHLARAIALTNRLTLRERLWIQAVAEDSRGNRAAAVTAYQTYLAQYPDDTTALFRLSWTQMAALGQLDDAAKGFTRLLEIDPRHATAQVNLATTLAGKGAYADAVTAYQKAFAIDPALLLGEFINHEYGFTLVQAGRSDEAVPVFEKMKREGATPANARGYRSMALLQMLRGRYAAAEEELRGAMALDQTHSEPVSEFRDSLYLITTLEARGRRAEVLAEWRAVDRLVDTRLSLSPDWALLAVRAHAHHGRVAEARRYLDRMKASVGKATADSGVSRNIGRERTLITVAEAEIDLADGRAAQALARLETAQLSISDPGSQFTLARAYTAVGRPMDAILQYEALLKKAPISYEPQQLWLEAHLAVGRLYEGQQRAADARRVYEALLTRWKDADADAILGREVAARLAADALKQD